MKIRPIVLVASHVLSAAGLLAAQAPQLPQTPYRPTTTIEDRVAGLRKIDGYFPLYWDEKTGNLLMEIQIGRAHV